MTIGEKGFRSDTGADNSVFRSDGYRAVTRPGGPFNLPAGIGVASSGKIFIADGYANCQVHRFSARWAPTRCPGASPEAGQGQFRLPHGAWVDSRDRVLIADRENDRVQVVHARTASTSPNGRRSSSVPRSCGRTTTAHCLRGRAQRRLLQHSDAGRRAPGALGVSEKLQELPRRRGRFGGQRLLRPAGTGGEGSTGPTNREVHPQELDAAAIFLPNVQEQGV